MFTFYIFKTFAVCILTLFFSMTRAVDKYSVSCIIGIYTTIGTLCILIPAAFFLVHDFLLLVLVTIHSNAGTRRFLYYSTMQMFISEEVNHIYGHFNLFCLSFNCFS